MAAISDASASRLSDSGTTTPTDHGAAEPSDAIGSETAVIGGRDGGSVETGAGDDGGTPSDSGAPAGGGLSRFNPPFPRIASYRIGGSQHYDATFQAWAAQQAVVIIGGNWEGWAYGGRTREAVVRGIKSQSTLGTKVLQYGICDNVDPGNDPKPTFTAQIAANDWYLWVKGTSGAHAINFFNPSFWQTNSTEYVPSDAKGRKLEDAFAVYVDAQYRTSGTANAALSLDGHYHDNAFFVPRTDGDFDRDGMTDAAKAFGMAWRKGERRYFDQLKAIDPDLIRFGNLDDMSILGVTDPTNTAAAAPLDGIMHGALLEGFLGQNYSLETFSSWAATMAEYRFRMNVTIAPRLVVCGHLLDADGSDAYTSTPYQAMRYGIGSVLLDDGYYAYSPKGYPDNVLFSFDELGGNPGGPAIGYLGHPKQMPPNAAWQSGVWRRDFDHGIALVNPKGNAARTVNLGGSFRHLTGKQNPSLNDGSLVTSVTLQERDGMILLAP
jgi:hypothetical protein